MSDEKRATSILAEIIRGLGRLTPEDAIHFYDEQSRRFHKKGVVTGVCFDLVTLPARTFFALCRAMSHRKLSSDATPPRIGELIICLFVPVDRQTDRLADFAELFRTEWLPRFGPRVAELIYIWQALRSGLAVAVITAFAAVLDRFARILER